MSKLLKYLVLLFLLAMVGGFFYLAVTDVPIQQTSLEKEITLQDFKESTSQP